MSASARRTFRFALLAIAAAAAAVSLLWSALVFEMPTRSFEGAVWTIARESAREPFSFLVYGDIQGNYRSGHNRLVDRMLQEPAELVFNTGDISEDDGSHYAEAFWPVVEPLVARKYYFPAPGNHDVLFDSPKSRLPYQLFFNNVLEQLARLPENKHLQAREGQRLWYSLRNGPALFVVLDSNWFIDEGRYTKTKALPEYQGYAEEQFRWLTALLKQNAPVPYKFVFFHHSPIVSKEEPGFLGSGGHPGHSRMLLGLRGPDGDYLLDLFRRYRITAVFTGHEHYYERWHERILERGQPIHQINWVVNGLGGVKPRGAPEYLADEIQKVLDKKYMRDYVERTSSLEAAWRSQLEHDYPISAQQRSDFHNYALVTVSSDGVLMQIKDIDGRVRDSAALTLSSDVELRTIATR